VVEAAGILVVSFIREAEGDDLYKFVDDLGSVEAEECQVGEE
jgi:hypothetical protein